MLHNKQPGDAASSSSNDDVSLDTQTKLVICGRILPGAEGQALVPTTDKIFNEDARMMEVIKTYTSKIMACHNYMFHSDRFKRDLDESHTYLLMELAGSLDLLKRTNITTLKFSSFDIGSYNFLDRILRNSKITTLSFQGVNINLDELANILINTNITTLDLSACNLRDRSGDGSPLQVDRPVLKLKDTNITTLRLSYNDITYKTGIDLAQGVKDSKITSLDLRNKNEFGLLDCLFFNHLKNSKITTFGIDACEDLLGLIGNVLRGTNVKVLYVNAVSNYCARHVTGWTICSFIGGLQGTNVEVVNFKNLRSKDFPDSAVAWIADALKKTKIIQIRGLPFHRSQEIEKVLQKNRDDLKQKLEYIGRALLEQPFYVKKEIVKFLYLLDYLDNLDSAFLKESSLFGEGHGEQSDLNTAADVVYKASKFQELSEAAFRGKNSGELDLTQVQMPLFMKKASPEFIKQYLSRSLNSVLKENGITQLKLVNTDLTDEFMGYLADGINATRVRTIKVVNGTGKLVESHLGEELSNKLEENSFIDGVLDTVFGDKSGELDLSGRFANEVNNPTFIKRCYSDLVNYILKEKDITKLKLNKATLSDETMDCLVNGIKGTKVTSIDVINEEGVVEFAISENLNIALSENSYVDNVTLALTNYAIKKNQCNASDSLFKEVQLNNSDISEIQSILDDIKVGRKSVKDLRDAISTYEENRMNPIMKEEFRKALALSGNYDALILIAKGPTQGLFFDIKK